MSVEGSLPSFAKEKNQKQSQNQPKGPPDQKQTPPEPQNQQNNDPKKGQDRHPEPQNGQAEGQGKGKEQNPSPPQDANQAGGGSSGYNPANTASFQDRLEILQAKQKALQEETERIKQTLDQLPIVGPDKPGAPDPRMARAQAREYLGNATKDMAEFQKKLSQAPYQDRRSRNDLLDQASRTLQKASEELALAAEVLENQFTQTENERVARVSQKTAEELERLADALDETVNPEDAKRMLEALEEAKRLLQTITDSRIVKVEDSQAPPDQTGGKGGFAKTNSHLIGPLPPRVRARLLALKFWSISIQARKRQSQLMEEEPSDAEFHDLERNFFERTATFKQLKGNE
jgi:hypothetical protein